ncbi:hypothetical protein HMPREF9714_02279 [Myroides odoratimimus CCUG 12901]|uniref:hypothetical protein n=1 Tax=Myroides odoratimimus TaxID=76832 RepID=UPI000246170F|nr:hypothetical protein [Myroides odoratimimus]EHO08256.1 hypothetical protein HMPREF9714_02279 [Myroides odoratimimus CCUG 12901]EKB05661.1 hypothetical protein HMPREF9711_01040 [Myroides odoratimimus CCUG 3837]
MNYSNYKLINFCSNKLIENEILITDSGFIPLTILKEEGNNIPIITIQTKLEERSILIIDKNISLFGNFKVNHYKDLSTIEIVLNKITEDIKLLEVNYKNQDELVIKSINLIPIGYSIKGNSEELSIGNSKYSENTIKAKEFIKF